MNEYEVAESRVLPYLANTLGWPRELIRGYGKVPVQVGTTTVWADYVCDITTDGIPAAWLLVEVKAPGSQLVAALPQAESYSLILGAPFFCITDGTDFAFYATRGAQGKSVLLSSLPPLPAADHLEKSVDYITFSESVDNLADLFIIGLKTEDKFYADTVWHDRAPWNLNERVFSRISKLTAKQLKESISKNLMLKTPNRNAIFSQIDSDLPKVREFLIFLRDFEGDPVANVARLIDKDWS